MHENRNMPGITSVAFFSNSEKAGIAGNVYETSLPLPGPVDFR